MLLLIAFEAAKSGLWPAISSALFGQRWGDNVVKGSVSALKNGPLCVLLNFPNLALPLMFVGIAAMRRLLGGPLAWAVGLMTAMYFLFAVRYSVSDQFMFFVPFYAMAAILAGLGFVRLSEAGKRRWLGVAAIILLAATPVTYSLLPSITQRFNIAVPGRTDLAYRDSPRYWLVPWKNNEDSAGMFARTAMEQVPPGSIVILDSTTFYAVDMIRRLEFSDKDVRLVILGKDSKMDAIPVGTPNVYLDSAGEGYHEKWMDEFATYDRPAGKALFLVVWKGR
ncbi:MAG: hypothetical protein EHM48_09655 [Planctomycetaceae bacterium]|nr:MAG: hypothetical protein EHM48_09655 [Planctomycetaceae bacterium]